MTDLENLVARLARAEIDLPAAREQLQAMTRRVGQDAPALRSALQGVCEREGLDAGSTEALLEALDATRVQADAGRPTETASPDTDTPTVVSPRATAVDAPTRVDPLGSRAGPAASAKGDAPTLVMTGQREASADAPTQVVVRGMATDTGTPRQRPAGTAVSSTSSDWARPDRWEPKHTGPIGVGTVLKERFVLQELLGRGGMGSVYRARDLRRVEAEDRETDVAIKLINEDFQHHPDAMVALQREAKKAQTLAHPNIVTVYDFDRDGATVFVSMAYLHGQPLDRLIRDTAPGALPMKRGLDILQQLANGLAYAHKKGFAHADFKPGNVFITDRGDARILDFGIARAAANAATVEGPPKNDDTRFDPTTLGAITPAYASLEMLQRQAPVPSDDVYALALVAYELLTGKHPFCDASGAKLPATEAAQRHLKPAPIKGLPRRYQRAIARGLAFARTARYPDAGAFVNAIKAPAKIRRSIAAAAIALAVLAGVSWWYSYEQSELAVTLADLPPALEGSRSLLLSGDQYFKAGKFAEAHEEYAQAWNNGRTSTRATERQIADLKVLVDRRVNKVIGHFLDESRRTDLDTFSLQVLRLNLQALLHSDLGTRHTEIKAALERLDQRLTPAK